MPTACPHCRFEVEVAPGFGAATCPACNNVINEADVFPAEPAAEPRAVDMSLPPEEEMPADFLASPSDFLGEASAAAVAAQPAGEAFSHDEMTLSLDTSSPADAANPVDAAWAPDAGAVAEDGGNFLASSSDVIDGTGDASSSTEGDLALDAAAPAEPSGTAPWDPGTVFPANEGNLAEAAWDSNSSAPPLLESPIGVVGEAAEAEAAWDPNAAPAAAEAYDPSTEAAWDPNTAPAAAEAPYDPNAAVAAEAAWDPNAAPAAAEPAYDPNADPAFAAPYDPAAAPETAAAAAAEEWAAPAEGLDDTLAGGAIPEPFAAPEDEDPYAGLPVNWESSAPGLPTRPRMLPTVNEDGSPHEESHAGAGAPPAPAAADDAFFDTAPGPDPIPAPPQMRAAVAPPPPPAAASFVGAAPPPLPAPPPPSPRVQVELESAPEPEPSSPPTLKPDAGTPPPSFAPQHAVSEFRAPERPPASIERPAAPSTAATPAATPEAPWASTPAPPASAVRTPAAPKAAAASAAIPGPRSRTPVYLGGAALALLVVAGGGFGLMKAFGGGGEDLPIATPNPVAMLSATPAPVETETAAVVEATPEPTPETPVATPTAIGAKTPKPTPTPKVKLTPTQAPTKVAAKTPVPTPTKVAATPAPAATARPAATPMPSTTKLAMTAATPQPVPTSQGSFLDAAPVQSTVKSTAGSRFGANPNVDMRDARYQALEAGHKLLDAWKTDEASKHYKKIVKANDTFADGHYWYGYASALQGETERACKEFNRYLVLAPSGYYAKNARTQIKNCN